ncbi:carboxypeptidase regulatory-like domain-containing protein [uncultured Chitinophaga sp.]|uniref:TonB-dependent receptor n=1 Tax=uncultured Chitinophaga sp. TaxID=339340 RepID=UPI0025F640F2|nr:carboxypeptidase regulatory-like domain-containing protein [uncultured Chitinophaga sp.]
MGFKKLLASILLVLSGTGAFAQVTTSSLTGTVKDKNEPLLGATVKATHLPTGTVYGTTSQTSGNYTIPNMRVGGPYRVEVTFVGYATQTFNDISLKLGQPLKLDVTLSDNSQTLGEVNIISRRSAIINPGNTGTSTTISRGQLETLPTVSRSVNDYIRLSTQAGTYSNGSDGASLGVSFGGQNNRYNQFAIDGATANDVFGLSASGTNGGQAGANPISIETIEQIQVVLNPYDVKQSGFTGGGINAITKSGTNDIHGSAYYYMMNDNLVGKSPDTLRARYGNFESKIFGATIGGPIIKNKLFIFASAERTTRESPVDFNPLDFETFTETELTGLSDFLKSTYGYDPGGYGVQARERSSTSLFGRIDWNINNIHRLTLRHSYVDGNDINPGNRTKENVYYFNNSYSFPSKTHTSVLELNSAFSNRMSNELRIGYNMVRDRRKFLGDPFPFVQIIEPSRRFYFGNDASSMSNALDQNIFTFTDNLTLYRGKHTITVGTSNEFYNLENTFIQNTNGWYSYGTLAGFLANNARPNQYQITYNTADSTDKSGVGFKAMQLGLYAQDEWAVRKNLRIIYGVRVDLPIFPTNPPANDAFSKEPAFNGYSTSELPKQRLLIAPRIGFNWDVFDNAQTQIRGGVGLFTGRVPFVWISNQYNNTGNLYTTVNLSNAAVPAALRFRYDADAPFLGQYSAAELQSLGASISSRPANVNITDRDFKFPQVFKTNLAVDQQLPWGVVATAEFNFARTINNATWENINFSLSGDSTRFGGNEWRPTWKKNATTWGDQIILLKNTSKGYSYNLTADFQKTTTTGMYAKVGYSFGRSYSLNDGTNSTANSNYRFSPNTEGLNNPAYGISRYDLGHRVLAVVSQSFKYGPKKMFATNVSFFYNGQSGTPYSWVYFNSSSDPTGDDIGSGGNNDLLYVPTEAEISTMRFAPFTGSYVRSEAQQREDFNDLIKSDKYLSSRRGKNVEKYGSRTPFEHVVDFKLTQDFVIYKTHKIQLSMDVLNLTNLLNNKWGRTHFIGNYVSTPVTFSSRDAVTKEAVFQYDRRRLNGNDGPPEEYYTNQFTSRWRMQLGARYSF